jgi:microcystin-dependent protein
MSIPYLSEIRMVSFNFAPKGWALCNGQTLPINQNQAIFALIGTFYGGNGTTNFQLPNLQGASPLHYGPDGFGNNYTLGATGGEAVSTITAAQMPAHSHVPQGVNTTASSSSPAGATWADSPSKLYGSSPGALMAPSSVSPVGEGQPHDNMPPYLVLNFVIALSGIFPSRN